MSATETTTAPAAAPAPAATPAEPAAAPQVDDILKDLTPEQVKKLKTLWLRLDYLTTVGRGAVDEAKPSTSSAPTSDIQKEAEATQSKAFQKAMADLTPEQLHTALWTMVKQDDPDTLLVRFLRARRWDVEKASIMLVASMHWRLVKHVEDGIVPAGDAEYIKLAQSSDPAEKKIGEQVLIQLRSGKSFARGLDKQGRPLLTIRVRLHRSSAQSLENLERYIIFNSETARMLLRSPNTTVAIIFDLTGFGMANMDWNALRLMASGLADNYPESMGQVYVYRAPWIVNGIWAAVRGWLDPEIASKVQFIRSPAELSEFVDLDILPTSMGGTSDWEYNYVEPDTPKELTADETADKEKIQSERQKIVDEYEETTRKWAKGELDVESGWAQRRQLFQQIKSNYWRLDKYVRGRTLLDRTGVIGADGSYNPLGLEK